jgi:hypothetical protein
MNATLLALVIVLRAVLRAVAPYALALALATALLLTGCGFSAPRAYVVPESRDEAATPAEAHAAGLLTPAEAAVVRDAVAAWCDATDGAWCAVEAAAADRGAFAVVAHLRPEDPGACPTGRTCFVAGHNDGDRVQVAADVLDVGDGSVPDPLAELWRTAAHEWGHFCTDHLRTGLMVAVHASDSPLVVDAAAVAAVKDGCGL